MLYSELQCSEAIHKAVERMGFAEMTEVQEKTIPVMLAGRDVIAKAPTGTGKTCAFGIPVAEHIDPALKAPQAVILAPTRELAQQIAEELTGLTYFMPEVQVVCVYGGANMEKQAKRLAEGCQIVVATPGRLMDHYKHHNIDLDHVTQVVLDEADEMLNMGFYKDVKHIIGLMKARKSLSMFSATISREVMDIGWMYQKDAEEITVQPKEESQPKITQYMLETSGRNKLSDLAQIIIGEGYKRVMVFCDTKFNTAALANQLARLGFSVDCLHGDLSQNERNRIMQNFRDENGPPKTGIALVIDTTISMKPYIDQSLNVVRQIYDKIEKDHMTDNVGFAVVAFRSSTKATPGLEYTTEVVSDFATAKDRKSLEDKLSKVQEAKVSSHDFNEDSLAGVYKAVEGLNWGDYSSRLILLITDAGPLKSGDKFASVAMGPSEVNDFARQKGIWITALHLKSPGGNANHAYAEQSYRALSKLSGNRSNYLVVSAPTPAKGAEQFAAKIGRAHV